MLPNNSETRHDQNSQSTLNHCHHIIRQCWALNAQWGFAYHSPYRIVLFIQSISFVVVLKSCIGLNFVHWTRFVVVQRLRNPCGRTDSSRYRKRFLAALRLCSALSVLYVYRDYTVLWESAGSSSTHRPTHMYASCLGGGLWCSQSHYIFARSTEYDHINCHFIHYNHFSQSQTTWSSNILGIYVIATILFQILIFQSEPSTATFN